MAVVIGIDEAGYGPNIGPLVVSASVWRITGDPRLFDFWKVLETSVSQEPQRDGRLQIADSKQVYSPARGLKALERSVLALLSQCGSTPRSLHELVHVLATPPTDLSVEPWFRDAHLPLPFACTSDEIESASERLRHAFSAGGIRCVTLRSDVVLTARFNELVTYYDNKAAALSRSSMALLRSVWDPATSEPTLVIGDKHGGRNRYDDLLSEILDGQMVFRQEEGAVISRYKSGATELRFQQKAEQHFPVAVSSMICKYTRELAMEVFNAYWQRQIPNLAPTKGYPTDAKRFRQDIAAVQAALGISNNVLWRAR